MTTTVTTPPSSIDRRQKPAPRQRKSTILWLMAAQMLAGLGHGLTFSMGSLLVTKIQGPEWGGAALALAMGGAAIWALPLGRIVKAADRRASLITGLSLALSGSILALTAAHFELLVLALVSFFLLGGEIAVNYQARFAAADVSDKKHRGRNLALVMWATTVGVVLGPQLFDATERLEIVIGFPQYSGAYLVALAVQITAIAVLIFGLPKGIRPDEAPRAVASKKTPVERVEKSFSGRGKVIAGIAAIAASHCIMISIMSMSAVHMDHHGIGLQGIGIVVSSHLGAMYILAPAFGVLSDRVSASATIYVGGALNVAAGLIIYLAGEQAAGILVGMTLLGFGWSAVLVGSSAVILNKVPRNRQGYYQSRSDLSMNLSGAAGGLFAGPLSAAIGFTTLSGVIAVLIALQFVMSAPLFFRNPSAN